MEYIDNGVFETELNSLILHIMGRSTDKNNGSYS